MPTSVHEREPEHQDVAGGGVKRDPGLVEHPSSDRGWSSGASRGDGSSVQIRLVLAFPPTAHSGQLD
jgi:hypothetical protein